MAADPDLLSSAAWMTHETLVPTGPAPARTAPGPAGLEFRHQLGQGGMGVVYLGHDLHLDRPVAVKVLADADPDLAQRFVTEARITGQLQHPGIVPVHQLGTLPDGKPFLVMKLIDGRTLTQVLADRPHPGHDRPALVQVFAAVAQAVGYAHSRGVVHRDLKPGNVMVGAFGEVQVLDWGLAKRRGAAAPPAARRAPPAGLNTDTLNHAALQAPTPSATDLAGTQAGTVVGTPAYMAPEQARGEVDRLDARTDVFALGALLCEILTGAPPHPGRTVSDVLARAAAGDPADAYARLDGCGAEADLVALCKACLMADPDRRPVDGKAVADAVAAHLAAVQAKLQAAEVARATAQTRLTAERQRRRLLAALAGVLLLGLAGVAALGFLAERRRERAESAEAEAQAGREAAEAAEAAAYASFEQLTSAEALAFLTTAPQLTPDQRQFLERAAAFFRAAGGRAAADPRGRARAATAQVRLAFLLQTLGDAPAAEAAYGQALALWAALTRDFPAAPAYRREWALAQNGLSTFLAGQGRRDAAEAAIRQAQAAYAALAREAPDVPTYRQELAGCHHNLGNLLASRGRGAAAVAAYHEALALREPLTRDYPAEAAFRRDLARTHTALGNVLADLGRAAEAAAAYQAALGAQESLVRDFPAVPDHRLHLARTHYDWGVLLAGRDPAAAAAEFQAALTGQAALAREFPAAPEYRQEVARSHGALGLVLARLGRRPEAAEAYRLALGQQEGLARQFPAVPEYRQGLAGTCVNVGNLERDEGRATEALAWFDRATGPLDDLHHQEPGDVTTRLFLRNAHLGRAEALTDLGRFAEAAAAWGQVLKYNGQPQASPRYQRRRAAALLAAGLVQDYAWPLLWGWPH